MSPSKRSGRQPPPQNLSPRELGQRAFHAGRLDAAISAWQTIAHDPAVAQALAEALFRRALTTRATDPLADLRRAATLAPTDIRFPFHLGRLLHRANDLAGAAAQYRKVLAQKPDHSAAAKLLALVTLQQKSDADLADLPGMTPSLQAWIAPALAVLRRQLPPTNDGPLGVLWRGLGHLALGDPEARATLNDERTLPSGALEPLRRYYRGVAAAIGGNSAAALNLWQPIYDAGNRSPELEANIAALVLERLTALVEAGDGVAAGALALRWAGLPGNPAFDELRLLALDQAAGAAAAAGQWPQATALWEAARQILGNAQGLGSPRTILHNLALAYERQERWEEAAEAWRGLLRARTRKRTGSTADTAQDEARWAWVRTRIISCYRHAGRPDEAVAIFRQALKLDPNDHELRLQFADALLANEQERAAQNEIKRILEIEPYHPEALLRYANDLAERWQYDEAQRLVRELLTHHPDRADLRRRAADFFMSSGRQQCQYGYIEAAYQAFVEGERYQPDNPRFPLNQARMLNVLHRPADVAALVERALTVGGESTETWVLAIETWLMASKFDEARTLIARFERERTPSADDYLAIGLQIMATATPPPAFPMFGHIAPPRRPADTPGSQLALELLEKAVALRPDDMRILKAITTFLMLPRPDLARHFVERGAQQAPEDPELLMLLGVALSLSDKPTEAKTTLQHAIKLAQRVNRPDVSAQAQEFRRVVGTPMLRMLFSASLRGYGPVDTDGDFFD
jgi:tetratricopeptide (TPR) repeat protein